MFDFFTKLFSRVPHPRHVVVFVARVGKQDLQSGNHPTHVK